MADETTASIAVNLNFLGVPTAVGFAAKVFDGSDHSQEPEYRLMHHVLEIAPEHLSREAIERYCQISTPDLYIPVLPVTEQIFQRLLLPLKSAKRCFALGEYLATIELCCHSGEMLATLLWEMAPVQVNGQPIDEKLVKLLTGRDFEKQSQDRRIDILRALRLVPDEDADRLDFLRLARRKHYHLWSSDSKVTIEQDAARAFKTIIELSKNVLQLKLVDGGKLSVAPKMLNYLQKHGAMWQNPIDTTPVIEGDETA